MSLNIRLLEWLKPLFDRKNRFCILYGGRGGAKSMGVASVYIVKALQEKCLILCCRQFQESIKDSVHSLIKQLIDQYGLSEYFEITRDEIRCLVTDSKFIFKGLQRHPASIQSIQGITDCWVEEAANISMESWERLKPTVRANNSQIVCTLNPRNKTDCIYDEFIASPPPPNSYVKKVNWNHNPYFPQVLENERLHLMQKDLGLYKHVWEGELLEHSDAQIFKNKWIVEEFTIPNNANMYYGLDFGFSQDSTAAIACFIKRNVLYISHEAGKVGLEIDHIGEYCKARIPDWGRDTVYADNSRPETISFLKRQGYNVKPVEKKKGSVEDGIEHIKSYDRVVVHPRCKQTIEELTLYSYKVKEESGEITCKIVDAYNHYIDALRYALSRVMAKRSINWEAFERFGTNGLDARLQKTYSTLGQMRF